MKDSQRFVFTAIAVTVAIELGSFSKLLSLWNMAFNPTSSNGSSSSSSGSNEPILASPGTQKQPKGCTTNPSKVIGWAPPTAAIDKNGCCPDGYSLVALGVGGTWAICLNNYNVNI